MQRLYLKYHFFWWHLLFAFIVFPILSMIGLIICWHVFHIDTSQAAINPNPLVPYLLVRLFWIPIFLLVPSVILYLLTRSKASLLKKTSKDKFRFKSAIKIIFLVLVGMMVATIFILMLFRGVYSTNTSSSVQSSNLTANGIQNLVNQEREKLGLNPLVLNQEACNLANQRLSEIEVDPSQAQANWNNDLKKYNYALAGENVGSYYKSNEDLVTGWINSPKQLENIINSNFTNDCISTNKNYAVQEFMSFPTSTPSQHFASPGLCMGSNGPVLCAVITH